MKLKNLRPMLECRDIKATIEFYTTVLGFTLNNVFEQAEHITWCDLSRDNSGLMFCLPNAHMNYEKIMLSGSLYINVEEVDKIWEEIKDKCEIVYGIENFEYGMREFAIKDNNGYVLNFGEAIN